MIAKVILFLAVVAAAHANAIMSSHLVNTGVSARSMKQDGHGNFAFGYDIKDAKGATNSRDEVGDGHGNRKGSYTITDNDGRVRKVEYVADGHGFRAVVKTNEPGTAKSAPAAALIDGPHGGISHIAPVAMVSHAAPVVMAAAPIAYGGHGAGLIGLGNGIGLGLGNGLGLGLGNGIGLGYGNGIGIGHGNGLGLANGIGLGYGAGMLGLGKGLAY